MKYQKEELIRIVLIIDRQHIVGFDLAQVLKAQEYEVIFESNLKIASMFIENSTPDFIIIEAFSFKELFTDLWKKGFVGTDTSSNFPLTENNMLILDKKLNILSVFKKPFHSELLGECLNKHSKAIDNHHIDKKNN